MDLTAKNFNTPNASPADLVSLNLALNYLNRSPTAVGFLQEIAERQTPINIVHGEEPTQYNPNTGVIDWNPSLGIHIIANPSGGFQIQDDSVSVGARSAAVALAHEAAHVLNPIPDTVDWDYDYLNSYEKSIVEKENKVAAELGEPQRFNYAGKAFYEADPTEHSTVLVDGSLSEGVVWVRVDGEGNPIVQGTYQIGAYPNIAPAVDPSAITVFDDSGTHPWISETSTFDIRGVLEIQIDILDAGGQRLKYYDNQNNHPYKELDVTKGPDGEIAAAQAQLEDNIIAAGGSVGQIFGSALGRALAPNNQFAQLAVGTVAGLIGQKLLTAFTASLTLDASRFVAGNFASVTGLDVAHAGIGAISSFLTGELGRALHLTGFGAELFNAGVGGVTGSLLTQVVDKMVVEHLSFDAAIGALSWSTAATQAGYNISSAAGSFLAHAFVPAQSHEGAVGGQLLGAVGSALGLSAVLNATITGFMGFLIPGLGSFFGTIVGTMLGDAIAGDPVYPMAYHDVRILGSDYHFTNRLVGTDNHGNAAVSEEMGDQVVAIANSYLDAVHGAGIHFSGKVMIGYNAGAAPYQYITGWFPDGINGPSAHFANATDAIQEGVRELLVNTEVIGGDLLMKRAHQAFINGPHPVPTEIAPDFTDLIKLSGDLSVAQDYQNYLNNREAINALMAAQLVRSRARRAVAQPRAGSRARLQQHRTPRSFAATANCVVARPKRCASIR